MSAENAKLYALPGNVRIKQENDNGMFMKNAFQKLTSLTPARDLTLGARGAINGASSAAKKVFTPNLNVVRNKNANVKTSKDTTARGRGRGRGERGGRGRGAGANSSLIQTTGVFSEGAGAVNVARRSSSAVSGGRNADESTSSGIRRPTFIKTEFSKYDSKADAAHIREVLGNSDEDDIDDKTDMEQIPIKLNEAKWKYIKSEVKLEIPDFENESNGVDISAFDSDSPISVAQKIQALHVREQERKLQQQRLMGSAPRYPQNGEEFLESTQQQLFLLQLPNPLPNVYDPSADITTEKDPKTNTRNESTPARTSPNTMRPNLLKGLQEGQIGKIMRYKSGKIKLVLGETYFDLNVGMETGFLQDLMSINTNSAERSGNMINLGPLQAKLTATPDWERMLSESVA